MGAQQTSTTERRPASDLVSMLASAESLANALLISALLRGNKLPDIFIEEEHDRATHNGNHSELLDIPVVDLAVLETGDVAEREKVVKEMSSACEKFGFLQIANHGVDMELVTRCEAQARRLFELPLEVKERAHRNPGEKFGYGANTWVDQTVKHWAESFALQFQPSNNVRDYASKLFGFPDHEEFRYVHVAFCTPYMSLIVCMQGLL